MVRTNSLVSLIAGAASVADAKWAKNPRPGGFIVEMEGSQYASSSVASSLGSKADTLMTFDYSLFKGASIQFKNLETADKEAVSLLSMPNVKNVWPISVYSVPNDEVVWKANSSKAISNVKRQTSNDTFSPHIMTQVNKLQDMGYVGTGIKIAVIDTGIDYLHPALGGCFGEGCLVSYGYDLVGDDYTGFNTPVPDDDPLDLCAGHGTHVSGIIAAQQNEFGFLGAAPGVTLGAYRVFGCDGQAGDDVLIDAYLKAFEDGSQIITASIGGSSGWSEEPWAVVVSRIVESGVPCTVSAGNSGSEGLFYASTAANGKKVTAIASFDNTISPMLLTDSYYITNGSTDNTTFGYSVGTPDNWTGVKLPLWAQSYDITDPAGGCDAYPDDTPDLSGYIVLIRRGTCTFVQKAQNAAAFGAKYIMIYNNAPGAVSIDVSSVAGIEASGMVTAAQGEEWIALLEAGSDVTLDMIDPATATVQLLETNNTVTGGMLSYYTSWGPTFEMDLKPQFGAPGGSILSTWPTTLGSYAVLSGTSMACPLTAAVYALIAEIRGDFDPATIEKLVAATSNPQLYNDASYTYDVLAPVAQQGAGLIQAYDAAFSTTLLSTSSLLFNDTDNLVDTLNLTISNLGSAEVTFAVGSVGAATAYTFSTDIFPDVFPGLELDDNFATVALSETKVTIAAGDEATISVTVTPPALDGSRLPVYGGYITLNGTNGESLSLPYQGVVGSLHSTQVLDTAYLSISTDTNLNPITGSNSSFVLSLDNTTSVVMPVAVVIMAFGSPLINIEAISVGSDNSTTKSLGSILGYPFRYAPRDSFGESWNGQLQDGSFAPAGRYKFTVSALHIFGDEADEAEYDVASSSEFSIRYA